MIHFIITCVTTVVLMQPCKPLNWGFKPTRLKVQSCSSLRGITTLPTLAAVMWRILHNGTESQVGEVFTTDSPHQRESPGIAWILLCRPSRARPLVIGSLCTVPPGHYDSLCRGKGAGIWRWSRRSWTAAGPAAGHIQHVQLRRQGRGGSFLTPLPHTGSPALEAKTEQENSVYNVTMNMFELYQSIIPIQLFFKFKGYSLYLILMLAGTPQAISDYSTNIFNINVIALPLGPQGVKGNKRGKGWVSVFFCTCKWGMTLCGEKNERGQKIEY